MEGRGVGLPAGQGVPVPRMGSLGCCLGPGFLRPQKIPRTLEGIARGRGWLGPGMDCWGKAMPLVGSRCQEGR